MKILIAIIILALTALDSPANEPKQIEPIQIEEVWNENYAQIIDDGTLPHFDAEKLLCVMSDNFMDDKALRDIDELFKDKYLKLTGTVYKVRNDFDGCYITIHQKRDEKFSDKWNVIVCYFKKEREIINAMKLKKGDKITLVGWGGGIRGIGPTVLDCILR